MFYRSAMRYAHSPGFTNIIYMFHKKRIVTCGGDGDIRIWRNIEDDDSISRCLGEYVTCIGEKDGKLLAATDRNTLQAYTFPEVDNDGTCMRFTAPIICMKIVGNYLAAGSEDMTIQYITGDCAQPQHLTGHTGPILSLDIHPQGLLLASCGGDGKIIIWDIQNSGKVVKTITGLPKVNSYENATYFTTPCFQPENGVTLAYVKSAVVVVLNTSTWETLFTLTDNAIKGNYTCCQFSTNGSLLVAGADDGEISVFNLNSREVFKCNEKPLDCKAITCLTWVGTKNNEVAYCDNSGQWGTVFHTSAFGSTTNMSSPSSDTNATSKTTPSARSSTQEPSRPSTPVEDIANNNDSDDETGNIKNKFNDADSTEELKFRLKSLAEEVNSLTKAKCGHEILNEKKETCVIQQRPFQPGSTPAKLEGGNYLVWNNVGIVTVNPDKNIYIEFHDVNLHHPFSVSNTEDYTMGSLSTTILVLASEALSKVKCFTYNSDIKMFDLEMPDCEYVQAITASSELVVVITNEFFARVFTVMGTQCQIFSIPGPILSLAAYEHHIFICYHSAPPYLKKQYLSGMLVKMSGFNLKCQDICVPLAQDRQLNWLGFSDKGSPVIQDSMGLMQLYNINNNCWHPIYDCFTTSGSVNTYNFIISVSEHSQIIRVIICHYATYPMIKPTPIVTEMPMQMPLCEGDTEKGLLEELLMKSNIMDVNNSARNIKETTIKLFAVALRQGKEDRAKELIKLTNSHDILDLAVKYSTKLGRTHFSKTLYDLLPSIEVSEQNRMEEDLTKKYFKTTAAIRQTLRQSRMSIMENLPSCSGAVAPMKIGRNAHKKPGLKPIAFKQDVSLSESENLIDDEAATAPNFTESENTIMGANDNNTSVNADNTSSLNNPFSLKRKHPETDTDSDKVNGKGKGKADGNSKGKRKGNTTMGAKNLKTMKK